MSHLCGISEIFLAFDVLDKIAYVAVLLEGRARVLTPSLQDPWPVAVRSKIASWQRSLDGVLKFAPEGSGQTRSTSPRLTSQQTLEAASAPVNPTAPSGTQDSRPPQAPPSPPAFGAAHVGTIIETSQTNDARFARDYKGQSYRSQGIFTGLRDGYFGEKQLLAEVNGYLLQCFGRASLANTAINWQVGDMITIVGTIDTTLLGTLLLGSCTASK